MGVLNNTGTFYNNINAQTTALIGLRFSIRKQEIDHTQALRDLETANKLLNELTATKKQLRALKH